MKIEDDDRLRVLCWFAHDDKVFLYRFTDEELQVMVTIVEPEVERIYWLMDQEEFEFYFNAEAAGDQEITHNLKEDFVWFRPSATGMQRVECTCGKFLEAGDSMDKLAKLAVKHSRRTGHTLNPRGN